MDSVLSSRHIQQSTHWFIYSIGSACSLTDRIPAQSPETMTNAIPHTPEALPYVGRYSDIQRYYALI